MVDPDFLDYLSRYTSTPYEQTQQAVPESEPSSSLFTRSLTQLANLPANTLNTGMQAMVNLGFAPESKRVPGFYDITPARTRGEQIVDVIGEGLLPQLGWAAATYGLGGAAGKAAGLGRVGSDVVGNIASGTAVGAVHSPEQAALGALFGGAYGGASWIPRAQRMLPVAGIAAADTATAYAQTGELGWSALQGGIGAATAMLPRGIDPRAVTRATPQGQPYAGPYGPPALRSETSIATQPSFEYLGQSPRSTFINPQVIPGTGGVAPLQLDYTPVTPNPSVMEAVYGPQYWREQERISFETARRNSQIADEAAKRLGDQKIDEWIAATGNQRIVTGLEKFGVLPPSRRGMRRASSAAESFEGYEQSYATDIQQANLQRYKREAAAKLGWQKRKLSELFPGIPTKRTVDPTGQEVYAIDELALQRQGQLSPMEDLAPWDYPRESGLWSNTAPSQGYTQAAYDFGSTLTGRPKAMASAENELRRQRELYASLPKNTLEEMQAASAVANRGQFLEEALQAARGESTDRMASLNMTDEARQAKLDEVLAQMGIKTAPRSSPPSETPRLVGGRGLRHGTLGGRAMLPPEALGGSIGAALGSQFGDTEEERARNAAYGLLFGFGIPAASRVLGPDMLDMARRGSMNAMSGLKDLGLAARETAEATAQELANVSRAVGSNVKTIFQTPADILAAAPKVILDEPPLMKAQKQLQIYRDMQAAGIPVNKNAVAELEQEVRALQPTADITAEINVRREFDPTSRPNNEPFTITRSVPIVNQAAPIKNSFQYKDPVSGATWELRRGRENYYVQQRGNIPNTRREFGKPEDAANYLDSLGLRLQDKGLRKLVADPESFEIAGWNARRPLGGEKLSDVVMPWLRTPQPGYNPTGRPNQLNLLPGIPNARTEIPVVERTGTPVEQPSGMKRASQRDREAAYTDIRIPVTIGGPLAGGLAGAGYGAASSEGDPGSIALGALIGAMAGGVLSHTLLSAIEPPLTKAQKLNQPIQPVKEAIKEVLNMPVKDQAGRQVYGDPTMGSKLARILETNGWKVPPEIKAMFTQARGAVAEHLQLLNDVVKRTTNFEVPDGIKSSATRFIEGQAIDPSKLKQEILRQGGLLEADWNRLKSKPVNYHTWEVEDDVFYMKPDTFSGILKQTEMEFRSQVPDQFKDYADLIVASRNAMNGLQELFSLGVGGTTGQKIKSSIGKHVVKTYDLFTNKKYTPTMEQIQRAAGAEIHKIQGDLIEKYIGGNTINDWRAMTEVEYQDALKKATPRQFATLQKYEQFDYAGSSISDAPAGRYRIAPGVKQKLDSVSDQEAVAMRIKQYIDERKEEQLYSEFSGGRPTGSEVIDISLLKKRKTFTPEFEEVLGVTKDPFARMAHSIDRLVSSSVAAKYVDSIKQVEFNNGLRAAYDNQTSWAKERDRLQSLLSSSPPSETPAIQAKIDELMTYKFLDQTGLRVGVLKDAMVSRYVYDQLKGYNTPWAFWDNAVGKFASDFSRWSKIVHAPYNPITQVRNAITAPMFMWIGRASPADAWTAAKALKGKDENYRELLRNGIITADEVTNEMTKNVDKVIDGTYDSVLLGKMKKPFKNAHEFILSTYQIPDQLVRASTYLSAKTRWAKELGLDLNDPRVIEKAVEWTDRYTMNYDNIAPLVRNLRRAPFVNIYIGYASEMARIAKNLAVDAVKGDAFGNRIHSMAILGALAGGAEGLQYLSEQNLSKEDRKKWDQTQRFAPDYSRSRYKYVLGKDEKGNFKYIDYTPLIITDNYNQMFRALSKWDLEGFMAVNPVVGWENTPIYKIITEQVAGENLRNEREFRGFDDRVRAVVGAMLPAWTPSVGYEWQKWGQAALGVENLRTGRKETVEGQVMKYLTGVGMTTVNSESVRKAAFARFRGEMATHKKYLGDILNTNLPAAVKEREVQKYRQAVEYLTAQMLAKLEGGSTMIPSGDQP